MTIASGPRLVVHDARGMRVVPIDRTVFTIGRAAAHDLQIDGPMVSRDHVDIITAPDGFYYLRDRQSRAGTFLNGIPVREARLSEGDRIECGRGGALLIFRVGEAAEPEATTAAVRGQLRQVARLLEGLCTRGTARIVDEVLALVLDAAIDISGAERGFVMLPDETGVLRVRVARGAGGVAVDPSEFAVTRAIPERVFTTGEAMAVEDVLEGELPDGEGGAPVLSVRHVVCVPLPKAGVLYVDSRDRGRLLHPNARRGLDELSADAAQAIANARRIEAQSRRS